MKIYKITYTHPHLGNLVAWEMSRKEAERLVKDLSSEENAGSFYENFHIERFDIKPMTEAVVNFLKDHTPLTDNG